METSYIGTKSVGTAFTVIVIGIFFDIKLYVSRIFSFGALFISVAVPVFIELVFFMLSTLFLIYYRLSFYELY